MGDRDDGSNSKGTQPVPLVRYGQNNYNIPGDPYGLKTAHSGNVAHLEDMSRVHKFPKFDPDTFTLADEQWASSMSVFLSGLRASIMNATLDHYNDVMIMRDTQTERAVDLTHEGMTVRVAVLKDVLFSDAASYVNAERAKTTEMKTEAAMARIDPEIGRSVENFMMAEVINSGNAPGMPKYRVTPKRPNGGDNKGAWYKQMRIETNKAFWLDHDREGRNRLRDAAKSPEPGTQATIETIIKEDRSHSQDSFYQYHRDSAAAEATDPVVYERIAKDVFVVFDREGNLVLCSVSKLFQRLFGGAMLDKVVDATKQWAGFALLPQPNTQRLMVDELMRRQHPELDMELATNPQELEERAMCIVHYGTWAQQGHTNPEFVHLTPDTRLIMGWTERRSRAELLEEVFPHFKVGVLGLSSEVARFVMRHLAPKEYQDCLETFRGLPKPKRMAVSRPNWATLFVLGINSFTQRHHDQNDIKNGLVSLIPMGNYTGGDLFFPQLGARLEYQPGGCVTFRGRELDHFVGDWKGYRIFVAVTNYQPVRNWVNRRLGKAPALSTDPGQQSDGQAWSSREIDDDEEDEDAEGEDEYVICVEPALDPEEPPEGMWSARELHGPGDWSSGRDASSSNSGGSAGSGGGENQAGGDDATSKRSSDAVFSGVVKRSKMGQGLTYTPVLFRLSGVLFRAPFWLLGFAFVKSSRPHPNWTLWQTLCNHLARVSLDVRSKTETPQRLSLEPGKEKDRFKVIEPARSEFYRGPLSGGAVLPEPIGGTWYPKPQLGDPLTGLDPSAHVVLHVHGGAFVIGDGRTDDMDFLCSSLVRSGGAAAVFCPQYRLSCRPGRAPFPAALQDTLTSYLYLVRALGIPAEQITVSGDSAGGNLVIAFLRYLAAFAEADDAEELRIPLPRNAVLVSPWVDPGAALGSDTYVTGNPHYGTDFLPLSFIRWGAAAYVGDAASPSDPYIRALGNPFATPVPIFVNVGAAEMLEVDIAPWVEEMRSLPGNSVEVNYEADAPHDTLLLGEMLGWVDSAQVVAAKIGVFIRERALGTRPALLVNGSLAVPNGRDVVPIANQLLAAPFVIRIATKDWHPADHISFAANHEGKRPYADFVKIVNPYNAAETEESRLWPVHCVQGTRGAELIPELNVGQVDKIIEKGTDSRVEMYSPFYDPFESPRVYDSGLAAILREHRVTDVYVVGLAADYCVKSAAVDAAKEGFRAYVVEEGTRAVDATAWPACRKSIEEAGAKVVRMQDSEVSRLVAASKVVETA
ncbi:hypothetical protein DL765_004939 [Monosporascus sp. GIB2]|nr:hypothetical protein DL765_004939 [Monosporascus sp. GIB2]